MRPALLALALALCLAAACGTNASAPATVPTAPAAPADDATSTSAASAASASVAPDGDSLAFGWPVPSVLRVRERADKGKGAAVTMRYELHVSADPATSDVLVDFKKFEFLEIDDRPFTAEEQAQFTRLSALTGAIPTLRIAPDGSVTVDDIESVIEEVVAFLVDSGEVPKDGADRVRAFFATPLARATLAASSLDFWHRWVSLWTGVGVEPGRYEFETDSPLPDGSQLTTAVTVVNAGPVEGGLSLSATWDMSGAPARRAVEVSMKALIEAIELERDDDFDIEQALDSARVTGSVQAVVDRATLVPQTLSSVETFEVQIEGEATTRRETHDYQFERVR